MKFIWAKDKEKIKNLSFAFLYKGVKNGDVFRLAAGDYYRVFINGRFLSFGPSRTAAGYSRVRNFLLDEDGVLVAEVVGYNTACYSNDKSAPFFGAELFRNGQKIADSDDFVCLQLNDRVSRVERYSYQRNYVEVYAQNGDRAALYNGNIVYPYEVTAEVPFSIGLLDSGNDTASYERIDFSFESEKKTDMHIQTMANHS